MPKSDWLHNSAIRGCLAFALMLALIAGLGYRSNDQSAYQQTHQEQINTAHNHEASIARAGFWSTYAPPKDTLAQWIMTALSAVATAVSAWAVLLVKATLDKNAAAVEQAKEANKIARDSAATENRAWLAIGEPTLTSISVIPGGFEGGERALWIEYSVDIENVGKTPARGIRLFSKLSGGTRLFEFTHLLEEFKSSSYSDGGAAIAPNERRPFRLNCTIDFDLPPEGTRHTISINSIIGCKYLIVSDEFPKETFRSFVLSQEQPLFRGGATITALDAHDIAHGTAEIVFRPLAGDMT